jgi:hypothetical protein
MQRKRKSFGERVDVIILNIVVKNHTWQDLGFFDGHLRHND